MPVGEVIVDGGSGFVGDGYDSFPVAFADDAHPIRGPVAAVETQRFADSGAGG